MVDEGGSIEQTLDITTVPPVPTEEPFFGDQYQNCVDLSVTLDNGAPLPEFMTFDPLTRLLNISPENADVGQYLLHVNYDYKPDTDNNPFTHEHSVPLTVEVVEDPTFEVSEFLIPIEEPLFEELNANSSNSTNETQADNSTAASNDTLLSEDLLDLIDSAFNPDRKKKKKAPPIGEPEKDPYLNITSISESGHMIIDIDKAVVVPQNYTDLPTSIFDVSYVCNSDDPVALA